MPSKIAHTDELGDELEAEEILVPKSKEIHRISFTIIIPVI
jgi:hypothetical protein